MSTLRSKKVSDKGVRFVARFEGFNETAYRLPGEQYLTIGYGHYGADVKPGEKITKKAARELLRKDLHSAAETVREKVKVKLNQAQFDALASFTFNVGPGAFAESTLLSLLNEGNYGSVPAQLNRWVNGAQGPLPGLVTRRKAEGDLFAHGNYH